MENTLPMRRPLPCGVAICNYLCWCFVFSCILLILNQSGFHFRCFFLNPIFVKTFCLIWFLTVHRLWDHVWLSKANSCLKPHSVKQVQKYMISGSLLASFCNHFAFPRDCFFNDLPDGMLGDLNWFRYLSCFFTSLRLGHHFGSLFRKGVFEGSLARFVLPFYFI